MPARPTAVPWLPRPHPAYAAPHVVRNGRHQGPPAVPLAAVTAHLPTGAWRQRQRTAGRDTTAPVAGVA